MSSSISRLTATLALCVLGGTVPAYAGTITQGFSGHQSAQENGCVDAIQIFTVNDCSYNGINRFVSVDYYDPDISTLTEADVTPPILIDAYTFDFDERVWIGPLANQMYYQTGASPFSSGIFPATTFPAVGDNKAELGLSGSLTINDNDTTADASDDLISGVIRIAAGTRNTLTGNGDNSRVEESWSSIMHTLAPTAVDSATPNAMGGFDYVIASRGIPDRLQPVGNNTQPYPSEIASSPVVTGVSGWVAPDSQGRSVATFECEPENPTQVTASWRRGAVRTTSHLNAPCADPSQNNIGASTTAVIADYSCISRTGGACPNNGAMLGAAASNPGYQNLLLEVSTDAGGHIVASNAFYTNEYKVLGFLFGFNIEWEAWDGGELIISGIAQAGTAEAQSDYNTNGNGVFTVHLYSNENLDAAQATNLAFGPSAAGLAHANAHPEELNGDELTDAVLHFRRNETGISCGDTSATLNGQTADGLPFAVSVPINVVGC